MAINHGAELVILPPRSAVLRLHVSLILFAIQSFVIDEVKDEAYRARKLNASNQSVYVK